MRGVISVSIKVRQRCQRKGLHRVCGAGVYEKVMGQGGVGKQVGAQMGMGGHTSAG